MTFLKIYLLIGTLVAAVGFLRSKDHEWEQLREDWSPVTGILGLLIATALTMVFWPIIVFFAILDRARGER